MRVVFHRKNRLTVRFSYRCVAVVIRVRCMSNVGLDRALSGSHTELSARQRAFFLHPLSHEPLLLGQSLLCVPTALGESTQSFEIAFERWGFHFYPSFRTLTPLCFHTERRLTPEPSSSTLPPFPLALSCNSGRTILH